MPLKIVKKDITKMKVEAIVNAANESLAPGGGVCGAIFAAAGFDKLLDECRKIGGCKTGKAVITKGYNLFAKYIIHTVGPVYRGGGFGEEELLYSCYKESLLLAEKYGVRSIAFPLISAGIFGYPPDEAFKTALRAIDDFLQCHNSEVYIAVLSDGLFTELSSIFKNF